jgi:hypothetical protein
MVSEKAMTSAPTKASQNAKLLSHFLQDETPISVPPFASVRSGRFGTL